MGTRDLSQNELQGPSVVKDTLGFTKSKKAPRSKHNDPSEKIFYTPTNSPRKIKKGIEHVIKNIEFPSGTTIQDTTISPISPHEKIDPPQDSSDHPPDKIPVEYTDRVIESSGYIEGIILTSSMLSEKWKRNKGSAGRHPSKEDRQSTKSSTPPEESKKKKGKLHTYNIDHQSLTTPTEKSRRQNGSIGSHRGSTTERGLINSPSTPPEKIRRNSASHGLQIGYDDQPHIKLSTPPEYNIRKKG